MRHPSLDPQHVCTGRARNQNYASGGGAKALTATSDIALITVGSSGIKGMPDVLGRTLAATATVRADVLLIHQSPAQDICLVTSSACASRYLDVLRREFVHDLASEKLHVIHDPAVALITVVGQTVGDVSEIVEHAFNGLARENVRIISSAQASSGCSFSFVVAKKDMQIALAITHGEFQAGRGEVASVSRKKSLNRPATWCYGSEMPTAGGA